MKTNTRPVNPYGHRSYDQWHAWWHGWKQCQKAMDEYYQEALQDPIGLLMSAEGGLVRMKDMMAQGDLWSGLDQTLALVRDAKGQIVRAVNEKEG